MKRLLLALFLAPAAHAATYSVALPGGSSFLLNGVLYANPDFTNSATVTWSVDGFGRILATSVGGSANVYTSSNNIFTGTNTFSADTIFLGPASFDTLYVGTLTVTNAFPSSGVTNATASRFAVWGADYKLTNDVAETGTGAPVRAVSPAFTGSPTVPTAAAGTSNTVAASTKYVDDALYSKIQPFDSLNRYIERVWSFDSGVTAAALEPGLQGAAITSGTLAARAGTLGYPGGVDFKTAATDVLNTGYYLYTGTAVILFTNELFFKWTGTINRTNGAIARIGFGDQLGTTAFTDGAYFAITNNQLIGVCRTSSSETVTPTATAYVVPQSTPISLYMAATNATVSFQAFEGSTLVWSDTLSAMPLGRDFGVAIQGWNGLAANTNAVSIMSNLRAGYRASVQ